MNVTEFAEQIVFGKTLEDKLLVPGRLTHDARRNAGPQVDSLTTPGRPTDLKMRIGANDGSVGMQPPSDDQLDNEQARGQLLHFLANHELLATELMALVLLKFPDAPHAFRQGILVTLQEEQEHTRMYIKRMKECGVEFGSFPVSGQFWRIVEPMKSPMDFVSRLSLTFEQANLDYSLHFASVFRNLGDTQTADVLQKIYEDEIGHVSHGLHWFQKWKNQGQSDWEAYQASLSFPMSPQRGRGPRAVFNREGRRLAGLSEDFIDAIEVFRQSRGRSPSVRWFDPAAEAQLIRELSPGEGRLMDQLGTDLEGVMIALSKQDDVLLVRRKPSRVFLKRLIDLGFDLPEFTTFEDRTTIVNRKLRDLDPWAWTPKAYQFAQPLMDATLVAQDAWDESAVDLYRKSWSTRKLHEWISEGESCTQEREGSIELPDWFTSKDCCGTLVRDMAGLTDALTKLTDQGWTTAIVKQDLASSGRGQRRLNCGRQLAAEDEAWLDSIFDASGDSFIVEPELERLLDLSFLWHLPRGEREANYLGWTRPIVGAGRRYSGTMLRRSLSDCDPELKQFVLANRCGRLQSVIDWLSPRLTCELSKRNFSGNFGVDAFVCRDRNGCLSIKPLVELNPRTTMGHVALNLEKRLAPGSDGQFRILNRRLWDSCHELLDEIPFEKSPDGRWKSGVVWLGEVNESTKLIPAVLVGSEAFQLVTDSVNQSRE